MDSFVQSPFSTVPNSGVDWSPNTDQVFNPLKAGRRFSSVVGDNSDLLPNPPSPRSKPLQMMNIFGNAHQSDPFMSQLSQLSSEPGSGGSRTDSPFEHFDKTNDPAYLQDLGGLLGRRSSRSSQPSISRTPPLSTGGSEEVSAAQFAAAGGVDQFDRQVPSGGASGLEYSFSSGLNLMTANDDSTEDEEILTLQLKLKQLQQQRKQRQQQGQTLGVQHIPFSQQPPPLLSPNLPQHGGPGGAMQQGPPPQHAAPHPSMQPRASYAYPPAPPSGYPPYPPHHPSAGAPPPHYPPYPYPPSADPYSPQYGAYPPPPPGYHAPPPAPTSPYGGVPPMTPTGQPQPPFPDDIDFQALVAHLESQDGMMGGAGAGGLPTGFGEHPLGEHPSRTLFVRNINSSVDDEELMTLFDAFGPIRSMYTACKHRGFVMISYWDLRHAKNAMIHLQGKVIRKRKIDIHFSIPKDNSSDKDQNQGTIVIFMLDPTVSNEGLVEIFAQFGDVKEVRDVPHKKQHKAVEFFDIRDAEKAARSLNQSKKKPETPRPSTSSASPVATTANGSGATSAAGSPAAAGATTTTSGTTPTSARPTPPTTTLDDLVLLVSSPTPEQSSSSNGVLPSPTSTTFVPQFVPTGAPQSMPYSTAPPHHHHHHHHGMHAMSAHMAHQLSPEYQIEQIAVPSYPHPIHDAYSGSASAHFNTLSPPTGHFNEGWASGRMAPHPYISVNGPDGSQTQPLLHPFAAGYAHVPGATVPALTLVRTASGRVEAADPGTVILINGAMARAAGVVTGMPTMRREGPSAEDRAKFALDLDKVRNGLDIRTTLMIKNIPNKYTQKMLLAAIEEKFKGTFDFFYLPIDFKNKCNVGYAFINFIRPETIVPFCGEFNRKKWEKFNSEKICDITYARIQSKTALITHFQNSSLMCEDKKCRPIIFHSEGPNAGEMEPFPVGPNVRARRGSVGSQSSSHSISEIESDE